MDSILTYRRAALSDASLLLQWRNDPLSCAMSLNTSPIPLKEHLTWLKKLLASHKHTLLLFFQHETPCAMVRFDQNWITIITAPEFRGQGVGKQALTLAIREKNSIPLYAQIKRGNSVSYHLFSSLGFTVKEETPSLFTLELTTPIQ